MVKRLVMVALAAAFVLPLVAQQDESFGDKVRQLLAEGTDLYKRGKYPEAASKFEEAFQMKPDSDAVYAFIKRAGNDLVAGMMNSPDRKMQDVGRRLVHYGRLRRHWRQRIAGGIPPCPTAHQAQQEPHDPDPPGPHHRLFRSHRFLPAACSHLAAHT